MTWLPLFRKEQTQKLIFHTQKDKSNKLLINLILRPRTFNDIEKYYI